jgi:DNA-binding response OmpR family regulator
MNKRNTKIFILENGYLFRNRLQSLCADRGKVWVADDIKSALEMLTQQSFQLLLLDWEWIQVNISTIGPVLKNFQPNACRVGLFSAPELNPVIAAMKWGMSDVFWAEQESAVLKSRLRELLSRKQPDTFTDSAIVHSYVSQLAEALAEKALAQKMSLFQAKREFSKSFLSHILVLLKMRHIQMANVMSVTARTLRRHLSK